MRLSLTIRFPSLFLSYLSPYVNMSIVPCRYFYLYLDKGYYKGFLMCPTQYNKSVLKNISHLKNPEINNMSIFQRCNF